jgi:hypothetical protein
MLVVLIAFIAIYFSDVLLLITKPPRFVYLPKKENRAIVFVVEDNGYLNNNLEVQDWYKKNKSSTDVLLTLAMKKPWGYFDNKQKLGDIIDTDGEDFMIETLNYESQRYGKIIPLKDSSASYENFKDTLSTLTKSGYTTDVVLSLHGSSNQICFYKECININRIATDLKNSKVNLGFVYQTVCFGSDTLNAWITAGAEVVNGSEELNTVVVLAPSKFLKEINDGKTYKEAVVAAYNYELSLYKRLSIFNFAKNYSTTIDAASSKMLFAGNTNYKPFQ